MPSQLVTSQRLQNISVQTLHFQSYLCRILGQLDILLLDFTTIDFTNFILLDVSSLIGTTSAFVKTEQLKDETSKKVGETNVSLHKFSLDVSAHL